VWGSFLKKHKGGGKGEPATRMNETKKGKDRPRVSELEKKTVKEE